MDAAHQSPRRAPRACSTCTRRAECGCLLVMTLGFLLSWTAFRQLGNSRDLPIRRKSVVLENRGMNSLGITQPPPGDENCWRRRGGRAGLRSLSFSPGFWTQAGAPDRRQRSRANSKAGSAWGTACRPQPRPNGLSALNSAFCDELT